MVADVVDEVLAVFDPDSHGETLRLQAAALGGEHLIDVARRMAGGKDHLPGRIFLDPGFSGLGKVLAVKDLDLHRPVSLP